MCIDRQKLQKLLWAEAASYRADCADWKRNTEALQDFLGEKTVEEVALELLAENEALRKYVEESAVLAEGRREELETLRRECDRLSEDNRGLLEDFEGAL